MSDIDTVRENWRTLAGRFVRCTWPVGTGCRSLAAYSGAPGSHRCEQHVPRIGGNFEELNRRLATTRICIATGWRDAAAVEEDYNV